jgi:hypothetical protein
LLRNVLIAPVLIFLTILVLLDFHRRLRAVEDRLASLSEPYRSHRIGGNAPSAEVRSLAEKGDTFEAIRIYRQESGVSLREAKEVVDGLSRNRQSRA